MVMEDGEGARTDCFRKMHEEDKTLGAEPSGRLMRWCPTMDLLAFVSAENHVAVHRLSWAKLLVVSENTSKVTALAWSPDGKTLVFGCEDGTISLFDIEVGQPIASFTSHHAQVTALQWASMGETADKTRAAEVFQDRASRFMPTQVDGNKDLFKTTRSPEQVTVLLSGDAQGVICMHFLGTFCVGKVHIAIPCGENEQGVYSVSIKHLCASSDLSSIAVQVESSGEDCTEMRSSDASEVLTAPDTQAGIAGTGFLLVLDTDVLSANAGQLAQISAQARVLDCMIDSLQASLQSVQKQWKEAWGHMSTRVSALDQDLRDHGSSSCAQGELLTCVASGSASPALQNFLTSTREQGLRRWEKAMDNGCAQIEQQATQTMLPTVEAVIFRAGELRGLSLWEELFGEVGLKAEAVEELVAEGSRCMHKIEQLLTASHAFHKGMGQLCQWLERLAARLLNDTGSTCISADDALDVAKFIKAHLTADRLAALIDDTPGVSPVEGEEQGPTHGLLLGLRDRSAPGGTLPLVAQVAKLRDAAEFALGETKSCVTSRLSVEATLKLYPPADPGQGGLGSALAACDEEAGDMDRLFTFAMHHGGMSEGLDACLVRVSRVKDGGGGEDGGRLCMDGAVCLLGPDADQAPTMQVQDVQFYSGTHVAAVTAPLAQDEGAAAAAAEGAGQGAGQVVLGSCESLDFGAGLVLDETQSLDVQAMLQSESMALQIPYDLQCRALPDAVPVKLAVNGARGLACVLFRDPWRMAMFDMEDGEGDEEEEGEEEEGVEEQESGVVGTVSVNSSNASVTMDDSMDHS